MDSFLGRPGKALDALSKLLAKQGVVTLPQLADEMLVEYGTPEGEEQHRKYVQHHDILVKWVRRPETKNYEWLAEATASRYEQGRPRTPGRFILDGAGS